MTGEIINHVRCPHCNTAFRALPEHAGRRAKCSHCGGTIVVPGEPLTPPPSPPDAEIPIYAGVNCFLCGTRMYGTLADVGKELKCPDCGKLTKLPPPEIKKKNMPAALEGEQYDLWEGDNQPWGTALSIAGPEFIAVECRLCQTHLQAKLEQVGKKIRCHDCGAENIVRLPAEGARPKPRPKMPVDEYEVEVAASLPTSPLVSFYLANGDEAELDADPSQPGTKARASKRATPLDAEFAPRPKLPRWPLIVGNFPFLGSSGVPTRIIIMSLTIVFPGLLLALVLLGGSSLLAVILIPATAFTSLIWVAAMTAASTAIVTESSAGNDEVYTWPTSSFMDWLPELGYFVFALMVCAFPGWLVATLSPELTQIGLLLMGGSILLCFPIVLLSQLDGGSVFSVLSSSVAGSWFRCPLSWLGLYLQSIAILALIGALSYAVLALSPWVLLPLAPLAISATFYYFRLMGRLAWIIEESTPMRAVPEEDEEKEP